MQDVLFTASLVGSLLLVVITAWYAWLTYAMVREMRDARRGISRPSLQLDAEILGTTALTRIENVGPGPAISIHVRATCRTGASEVLDETTWHCPILRPGESRTLLFPLREQEHHLSLQELHEQECSIELAGQCADSLGGKHDVRSVLVFDQSTRRDRELVPDETGQKIAKSLEHLKPIADEIKRARTAIESITMTR